MRTLTTTAIVRADHTLTVSVPADIPPGPQTVVVVLQDGPVPTPPRATLNLPPHAVGPIDPRQTYRREDLYGADGR